MSNKRKQAAMIAHSSTALVLAGATAVSPVMEDDESLSVTVPITDVSVSALVQIQTASRAATISFNYLRTAYEFSVTKWSGRGFSKLSELFFVHATRDAQVFGEYSTDEYGDLTSPPFTRKQRRNIVFQACVDVLTCLGKIVMAHQRQIQDYAIWYRETQKARASESYSSYITLITCHCIIHEQFTSGSVQYELVEL